MHNLTCRFETNVIPMYEIGTEKGGGGGGGGRIIHHGHIIRILQYK